MQRGGHMPMNNTNIAMHNLIERVAAWAEPRADLRAAIIVGSYARHEQPADRWSDLDLLLVTTNPQFYLATSDWLAAIGEPWLTFLESTAVGSLVERRVLFADALDVDFSIVPFEIFQQMLTAGLSADVRSVFQRGMRVLFDKDGVAAQLNGNEHSDTPPQPPTETAFLQAVNDMWYHVVWAAKKLRRGEVWIAKMCCDVYLKALLLQMVEWHTLATKGPQVHLWFNGRFLETWGDPRVIDGLRAAFAYYDAADVQRALFATLDLFDQLASEVAAHWNYSYPLPHQPDVLAWIKHCLPQA